MFQAEIPRIIDSHNHTYYPSGASRDSNEGKGRCDLIPWDTAQIFFPDDEVPYRIGEFIHTKDTSHLCFALNYLCEEYYLNSMADMMLDLAVHFEEGSKKYPDRNWELGLPVSRFIDSAMRHYLKFLRGDGDEPHMRATVWNIICGLWTADNRPEMIDI